MNLIAVDFEATNRHPESACSLASVMVGNNKIIDRFYTVINPQVPLDGRNIQVHQITPDDVKDVPTMAGVWPKIKTLYQPGVLVAAHNARFDANVLRISLARYDIDKPYYLVINTLKTNRSFEPDLPNHKLNTITEALDVELWHHHSALGDSKACAGILIKQNEKMGNEVVESLIEQR